MTPLTTMLYNVVRLLHIATTSSCKCREIPYPSEIPIIQWFNKTMPFHALSSYSAISSYSSRRPMFLAAAEFFAQPEEHWKTSHVLWQQTCSNKAKKIKSAAMLRIFNECSHVFSCHAASCSFMLNKTARGNPKSQASSVFPTAATWWKV